MRDAALQSCYAQGQKRQGNEDAYCILSARLSDLGERQGICRRLIDLTDKIRGSGTTATIVSVEGCSISVSWIGDTSVYLVKVCGQGVIWERITVPHSMLGIGDDGSAARCLGHGGLYSGKGFEYKSLALKDMCTDDMYLVVCTDGLTEKTDLNKIFNVFVDSPKAEFAQRMKDVARERSVDDITVVVSQIPAQEALIIGLFDGHSGNAAAATCVEALLDLVHDKHSIISCSTVNHAFKRQKLKHITDERRSFVQRLFYDEIDKENKDRENDGKFDMFPGL